MVEALVETVSVVVASWMMRWHDTDSNPRMTLTQCHGLGAQRKERRRVQEERRESTQKSGKEQRSNRNTTQQPVEVRSEWARCTTFATAATNRAAVATRGVVARPVGASGRASGGSRRRADKIRRGCRTTSSLHSRQKARSWPRRKPRRGADGGKSAGQRCEANSRLRCSVSQDWARWWRTRCDRRAPQPHRCPGARSRVGRAQEGGETRSPDSRRR